MPDLNKLAARVLGMCKYRNWSLSWLARGVYLHLETSELIEAIRGKGDSTPLKEAADVLLVLMSITENAGIPFNRVIETLEEKLVYLEQAPPYPNEEIIG